jgi:hypothetical protein
VKAFIIFLSLLFLFESCQREKEIPKEHAKEIYKQWVHNFRNRGGKLYDRINYYEMQGIDEYNLDHLTVGINLFGLIKHKEGTYEVIEIITTSPFYEIENKPIINHQYYHQIDDYLKSTVISEDELGAFREVQYIFKDHQIIFSYFNYTNYEYLYYVQFFYKNTTSEMYYTDGNIKPYIESDPYLKEEDVLLFLKKNNPEK